LPLPLVQENFLSTPSCLASPQDLYLKKRKSVYLNQSIAQVSTAKKLGHEMNYGLTALLWRKFKRSFFFFLLFPIPSQRVCCRIL
jgi:hypothetical protein